MDIALKTGSTRGENIYRKKWDRLIQIINIPEISTKTKCNIEQIDR